MKKNLLIACFCLFGFSFLQAQNLKLDEVLAKYYKASGMDKLQKIKTVTMSGTITRNDVMPLKITRMRPDKYRMDYDVADISCIEACSGEKAWILTPYTGNAKPQALNEERTKDVKLKADFDGLLWKWQEKGHKVELAGTEKLGNSDVYKIKMIRKDGGTEYYFIDSKSFLVQKRISYRLSQGKEIEVENNFADYRAVNGIMFSFLSENKMGGQAYSTVQYDSIDLDKVVDPQFFDMPMK